MPDVERSMDNVAEVINNKKEDEVLFTSLDMLYAYGQTELQPDTANTAIFGLWEGRRRAHMRSTQGYTV